MRPVSGVRRLPPNLVVGRSAVPLILTEDGNPGVTPAEHGVDDPARVGGGGSDWTTGVTRPRN